MTESRSILRSDRAKQFGVYFLLALLGTIITSGLFGGANNALDLHGTDSIPILDIVFGTILSGGGFEGLSGIYLYYLISVGIAAFIVGTALNKDWEAFLVAVILAILIYVHMTRYPLLSGGEPLRLGFSYLFFTLVGSYIGTAYGKYCSDYFNRPKSILNIKWYHWVWISMYYSVNFIESALFSLIAFFQSVYAIIFVAILLWINYHGYKLLAKEPEDDRKKVINGVIVFVYLCFVLFWEYIFLYLTSA